MIIPDEFMSILLLLTLYSFPISFVSTAFGLGFWGAAGQDSPWSKTALFALVQTVTGSAAIHFLPLSVHAFYFPCHFFILFLLFFRSLPKLSCIAAVVTALLCYSTVESLGAAVALGVFSQELVTEHPPLLILTSFPIWLGTLRLTMYFHKHQAYPGLKMMQNVIKRTQAQIVTLFALLLLFHVMIIVILIYLMSFFSDNKFLYAVVLFFCIAMTIVIITLTLRISVSIRDQAVQDTQMLYIEDMNRLFTTIRGQRHDFMNHLQVVYSMAQCNKFDEMKNYISQLFKETTETNQLLDIGHPAIAALMQSKLLEAEIRGIEVRHSLSGVKRLPMGKLSVDLIKIAANLIDNALDEAENMPDGKRWVEVTSYAAEDAFHLIVSNGGRTIPQDTMHRLFIPGYSTKDGNKHSGLGLAIVKELVQIYRGTIRVMNLESQGVSFHIVLPITNT